MARGIAKITDDGADIVLKSTLTDSDSVLNAEGAAGSFVGGTPSFSANGMVCVTASARFDNLVGSAALDTEGQIVVSILALGGAKQDNLSSANGSTGVDVTSPAYIWSGGQSFTNKGRLRIDTAEDISFFPVDGVGGAVNFPTTSNGKDTHIEVCKSWTLTRERLFIDGVLRSDIARTAGSDIMEDLQIGALLNNSSNYDAGGNGFAIKNLVISNIPVTLDAAPWASMAIGGDSFAVQAIAASANTRYDGTIGFYLTKWFVDRGFEPPTLGATSAGFTGYTLCDSDLGNGNLVDTFAAFAAGNDPLVIYFSGNNDISSATEAEINNVTTGTDARAKELLALLTGATDIVFMDVGSVMNNLAIQNSPNAVNYRDNLVNPILRALPAFDTRVKTIDSLTLLNDASVNPNFQGYWDGLGNLGSGGSAAPETQEDRHLAAPAGSIVAEDILRVLFAIPGSPVLTTPYINQVDNQGDVINLDLTTNWTGATSYAVAGLPSTLVASNGIVTGTLGMSGSYLVGVTACNINANSGAEQCSDGSFTWFVNAEIRQMPGGQVIETVLAGESVVINAPGGSQVSVTFPFGGTPGVGTVTQFQHIRGDGLIPSQRGGFIQVFDPAANTNGGESMPTSSDYNEFQNDNAQTVLIVVKPEVNLDRGA